VRSKKNSALSFLKIRFQGRSSLLLKVQREVGIIKSTTLSLTQLGKNIEDGSKTEKMFVIILRLVGS